MPLDFASLCRPNGSASRQPPVASRRMKTDFTSVVLIPPAEAWEPIQAIRREHDRQVRRWMPHVNLLYPFRPEEEFDAVLPALAAAAGAVAPFDLELREFRWFRHGPRKYTVWLAPEPEAALVGLQRALAAAVPDCDDQARHAGGFRPHLSVGQYHGSEEHRDEFLAALAASWRPLRFAAREVCLIARGKPPEDIFEVKRRIALGSKPA